MKRDTQRYEVRLAQTGEEIAAAQRLRYRVFVEELGATAASADHSARLERDDFDDQLEHLILIDGAYDGPDPLDRVVGVYRLLPGERAGACGGFYSASEYDLSRIEALGRPVVELGRSCVDAAHRGGLAMHMMWNALARYVLERKIEILFGVASFHGTDPAACAHGLGYLHARHLAPEDLRVQARDGARVDMDRIPLDQVDRTLAMAQIPSLIKAYLRLGGFVGDGAWIDRDFNTIDVCLVVDTARMQQRHRDYYIRDRAAP